MTECCSSLSPLSVNFKMLAVKKIKQSIPAYMKRIRHPSVYQSPQFSTTQATHILSIFRNEIQDYSILCVFLIVVIKFLIVCLSSFAKQRAKLLQTLLWSQLTKAVHCLAPGFFLMSICSSSSATSIIVFNARFFSFSRSSSACNSCSLASSASTVSFFSGFLVSSDIGI